MTQQALDKTIKTVLDELRLLRQQVALLLPQDELKHYVNARRIQRSYQKAIKEYPPAFSH